MATSETPRTRSKRVWLVLFAAAVCFGCVATGIWWFHRSRPGMPSGNNLRGPTFIVSQADLHAPVTVIAYGDMRFTDPLNTTATNPRARQALVKRIAEERPDALLLNGDVPWHGGDTADYGVYAKETQAWRDAHLRVFPTLGNHEFSRCEVQQCLANWWAVFPELKGFRWYSVRLGTRIYLIALDSDDSLLPGSEQRRWLESQIASLPTPVQFVLITMHHPPVADIQTRFEVSHNPRPNEIALAQYLRTASEANHARFVVIAGHIHNYERFLQGGVVYFVSGGGGAKPYPVDRSPSDLYQDPGFPNYHYVKFVLEGGVLRGAMYRFSSAGSVTWRAMDSFQVPSK